MVNILLDRKDLSIRADPEIYSTNDRVFLTVWQILRRLYDLRKTNLMFSCYVISVVLIVRNHS